MITLSVSVARPRQPFISTDTLAFELWEDGGGPQVEQSHHRHIRLHAEHMTHTTFLLRGDSSHQRTTHCFTLSLGVMK